MNILTKLHENVTMTSEVTAPTWSNGRKDTQPKLQIVTNMSSLLQDNKIWDVFKNRLHLCGNIQKTNCKIITLL